MSYTVSMVREAVLEEQACVRCPEDVLRLVNPLVSDVQEHFYVILLDNKNAVLSIELVSLGTINASLVHPRDVFRRAIKDGASTIILSHNHPSGNLEPSAEDVEITRRLREAGAVVGIEILDHVIVGKGKCLGLRSTDSWERRI